MNEYDREQLAETHDSSSAPADRRDRVDSSPGYEMSEFERHGDPSLAKQPLSRSGAERVRTEIVWMRPTELVPVVTGRVAGQGIDLESSIARRARALPTQSVAATRGAIRDRARQLPPVTAFGRGRTAHDAIRRSGIGR